MSGDSHFPDSGAPSSFGTAAERPEGIAFQIRRWCEQAKIEGSPRTLSDTAAVLIAAGHLDEPTRHVLTNRRRAGRSIPSIGGFGTLRLLTDEYGRAVHRRDTLRPGATQLWWKHRASELGRKIQAYRCAVVLSTSHYGSGVRAMRRDRREGVHLDLGQRERLFSALQQTPVPLPGNVLERVGDAARSTVAEKVSRASEKTVAAGMGRRMAEVIGRGVELDNQRFSDSHDTLLFLAGMLFDRIDGSPVWHSEYFVVQRRQLDLAEELTQIAVDTVALRGLVRELDDALRATTGHSGREQVRARQNALRPVWDQLVDRVAALARIGDLLTRAEVQLRSVLAVNRAMSLDSRIDGLLARSGERELSAANTHYVGDQFDGVDELILTCRSALHGAITELTSWSRT